MNLLQDLTQIQPEVDAATDDVEVRIAPSGTSLAIEFNLSILYAATVLELRM
ncbi:hypothetical protein ACPPVO_43120 [Dactylosporangium sp. McL0621]|uniref:hypothetical protein n=1 Tax=Dactylosporangium sp. McL0621 TaxID=3415678 RepID=UPI003CE80138